MKKCFLLFFFFSFILFTPSAMAEEFFFFSGVSEAEPRDPIPCWVTPNYHTVSIPKTGIVYLEPVLDPNDYCYGGLTVTLNWIGNRDGQCHETLYPHLRSFSVVHLEPPYYSPEGSGPIGLNAGTYELKVYGSRGTVGGCDPNCPYMVALRYQEDLEANEVEPNDDWEHLQLLAINLPVKGSLGYSVDNCGKWDYADGFKISLRAGQSYNISCVYSLIYFRNEAYSGLNQFFWDKIKDKLPTLTIYDKNNQKISSLNYLGNQPSEDYPYLIVNWQSFIPNITGEYKLVLESDIVYWTETGGRNLKQNLSQYTYSLKISDGSETHELTMGVFPGNAGITIPSIGTHQVKGQTVAISAASYNNWRFAQWFVAAGDATVENPYAQNTIIIGMHSNAFVYAVYAAVTTDGSETIWVSKDETCRVSPYCFETIQDAFDFSISGVTFYNIIIASGFYPESYRLTHDKTVRLSGGWNSNFSSQNTPQQGEATICCGPTYSEHGTIIYDNLIIVPQGSQP